jgi:hypothetical protein
MTDVDPRDYIDMFLVEVESSALEVTSLTEDYFDEESHSVIFSHSRVDGEHRIEFTTEQGAEKVLEEWNESIDTVVPGGVFLTASSVDDESDIDARLSFRTGYG